MQVLKAHEVIIFFPSFMLKVVKYKTSLCLYFYLEQLYLTTVGLHSQMAVMDWSWITITYCDDYFSTIPTTPYCLFNMRASHLLSSILLCILFPLTESTISAYLVPHNYVKKQSEGVAYLLYLAPLHCILSLPGLWRHSGFRFRLEGKPVRWLV